VTALLVAALPHASAFAMASKFRPTIKTWQAPAVGCSISVYFGSIGTGPGPGGPEIRQFLEREAAVTSVQPYLRGREGETELCVKLRSEKAMDAVYQGIKKRIPARSGGGWTEVRARDGRLFSNER